MRNETVTLTEPRDGAVISPLTDVQREFLRRCRTGLMVEKAHIYDWIPGFTEGKNGDMTAPAVTVFRWTAGVEGDFTLEISADKSFSSLHRDAGPARRHRSGEYEAAATNLMIGTRYFWRVRRGDLVSEVRTFTTADEGLRQIFLQGVPNVRDMGGKTLSDGRRSRQGLLYRSQAITGEDGKYRLTEPGENTFFNTMGIRTDLDLRADGTPAFKGGGCSVRYVRAPLDPYDIKLNDKNKASVGTIFELLSDERNYPVFIHCQAGADRTGTLALLLEGILGVPEGEIVLDYDLSTLSGECERNWYENELIEFIIDDLRSVHGDGDLTYLCRARAEALGVPASSVDAFRRIMTE